MEETKDQVKPKYSKEDFESVLKGIRPEHMDFLDFKAARKYFDKELKAHKRGTFLHISQGFPVKDEETGKVEIRQMKKGMTYTKSKDI